VSKQIAILNDVSELRNMQHAIEVIGDEWQLSMKVVMNINLVLEEIISNIIFYGYEDDLEHEIRIDLEKDSDTVTITITDDGKAFNIMDAEIFEDTDKPAEERNIGGLGIHFIKTLMDQVEYRREANMNILTLKKKI